MATPKKPNIIVIVGETASGKSELALRLAKKLDGEIISGDSWQVYKGFDIGTAKPSDKDREEIRHHLIDIVDPKEGFSAPLFKKAAEQAIQNIHSRRKLPIVAGGTGLYIDSLLFDYGFLPDVDREERHILNQLSIPQLIDQARSMKIDLDGIDLRNKRRIIRAIEAKGQKPRKKDLKEGALVVGVRIPRDELRQKIENRVEQMFKKGLTKEVKELSEHYGWDIEPMKGIGYREFRYYFDGQQTLEQTKKRIISSTMNLAKRQRTWFKRHKFIQWFDSSNEAFESVVKSLNN